MSVELERIVENTSDNGIDWLNPMAGFALAIDGREAVAMERVVLPSVNDGFHGKPYLQPVPDGPVLVWNPDDYEAITVRISETDDGRKAAEHVCGYRYLPWTEHTLQPRQAMTVPGMRSFVLVWLVSPGRVLCRPVGLVGRGPAAISLVTSIVGEA